MSATRSTARPDDPFVRLLRQRIASGHEVVRLNLTVNSGAPEYVLLMSHLRQLSELRMPHSRSFTRWSFDAGARLASHDEEARRFGLLLAERLQSLEDDLGDQTVTGALMQWVPARAPPRTTAMLPELCGGPVTDRAQLRARRAIDDLLGELAASLGRALHYPADEAAGILDDAIALFVRERLGRAPPAAAAS